MSVYPEERRRDAVLVGLLVLALLAGVAWWTRADPGVDAGAAAPDPGPRAGLRPGTSSSAGAPGERGVPGSPSAGSSVVVDAETGQVIAGADPGTSLVLGNWWPSAGRVGAVRWRDTRLLTDNVRSLRRQTAAAPGQRFRLLLTCAGPGELRFAVANARLWRDRDSARCDGSLHSFGITAFDDSLLVRISHPAPGAVELTALLVAQD